ncbi:hypothetical protein MBLNU459_g6932t1 [Dothideomycetes sp. NU459]
MGRKPNALILEYFERGPKLNDQSNRYQHTCKRCGEVFPKGRPDSLQRHIFEKCPNVTETDRTRALWQQAPDQYHRFDVDVPYLAQREPSGLDALAEVSRQMQENGEAGDESLAAQLRLHMDGSTPPSDDHAHTHAHAPASAHSSTMTTPPAGYAPADESPLVNAASAANELADAVMQHTHTQPDSYPSNPRKRKAPSDASEAPVASVSDAFQYHPQRPPPAVDPQLQPAEDFSTLVAPQDESNPDGIRDDGTPSQPSQGLTVNSSGFGLLQRTNRSKARGRFSEERRKEVQSVRKKGACIRCRMLKKPCSEGTPCGTCKNIESARLWKNQCIRTRIADEFTLYQASFFFAKDRAKVFAALGGKEARAVPGRVEVTLFPDTDIYATFAVLQTDDGGRSQDMQQQGPKPAEIDPDLINAQLNKSTAVPATFMLSYKGEDTLAAKLERYIHAAIMQCISREPSPFMRSTLECATELGVDANDALMSKLINLWAATNLLITKEPLWSISYDPQQQPGLDAVKIGRSKADGGDEDKSPAPNGRRWFATDSRDYDLIHSQLQDATERYCQKQAKWVMNELERRLLQRQQSSSFLTFLAAVILLNCVERMTGLFRSFDMTPPSAARESRGDNVDEHSPAPANTPSNYDRPAGWPLDDPPSKFWRQGESFSSLLHLLLRMRGLPPTTMVREDGTLAIMNTFNKTYPGEVTSETQGGDSQLHLAAMWIERTGVDAIDLFQRRDMAADAPGDGDARSWDLRFVAPLLLPQ